MLWIFHPKNPTASAGIEPAIWVVVSMLTTKLLHHYSRSVGVVKNCPSIPLAVVQYTFTHKQYTEQNNETEYTELNIHKYTEQYIHNNNNT
jgi:hypothetical protein